MKKRILAVVLTLIMLFGMVPVSALAADSTVVYTNGTDGSNWPVNGAYVNTVTLSGATVSSYSWAGDICNIILAPDTPADTAISFNLNMMGQPPLILQSTVSIDGVSAPSKAGTVTLSGGKKTVPITVSMRGTAATKTFQLEVAGGSVVNTAPTLAEGVAGTATAERYVGSSFELDLTKVFTDAEDTALSYTVKIGNASAVEAAASYSYIPTAAGTYTLVFTASDGKNSSPSHTVTLTVKDTALSLDKAEAEVDLGSTLTLTATTTPAEGAVVWTSSAESVATVENGVVTPVAAGTATITATFGGKTASCVVTVNDPNELKANVTLTLNDAGTLALIHEPVKVVDTDNDGVLTYHDALVVVHKTYGKAYVADEGSLGRFVTTLWDKNTGGSNLFFINNSPIPNSVGTDIVSSGDHLYATTLIDAMGWSDWYTYFDKSYATVDAGDDLTLTLSGYMGMSWGEIIPAPVAGVSVGTVTGGEFDPLSGKTTGADGKVTLSFDQPGTYIVSASGTANGSPLMPPVCIVTVKAVEVDGISLNKSELTLKLNKSETLTATATPDNAANKSVTWTSSDPTVATVNSVGKVTALKVGTTTITAKTVNNKTATCTVTVELADPAADAQVTMSIGMRGVLALANAPVTVKDLNSDGILTYDEALVAAHKDYCPSGIDGLTLASSGWIIKLWGTETANLLFFRNNVPLTRFTNDKTSVVKAGDSLYAAVLMYETSYKDYYSCFDKSALTVKAGEEFTLSLTGYVAAHNGSNPTFVPISGASVGTWDDGEFTAITGKTTDTDGKVTLRFEQSGTYVVSAYDNSQSAPLIAPYCIVTVEAPEAAKGALSALKFTAGTAKTAAEYALSPAFSSTVFDYTIVVPDSSTSLAVWATLEEGVTGTIKASYQKTNGSNGNVSVTSGKATGQSLSSALSSGKLTGTTVTVTVGDIAYTVKVIRRATLSKLELAAGEDTLTLDKTFSSTATEYTARIPHDAQLSVTATPKSTAGSVSINGGSETTVTPVWNNRTCDLTITVSGDGAESSTYTVHLAQRATAIEILTPPAKTEYEPGEKFNPDGMTLKATYSDGTTETIAADGYTYEPDGQLSPAEDTIAVLFDGLTVTQPITLKAVFEGSGTKDVPYLLKTTEDMETLSELVSGGVSFVGEYFQMANDITLPAEWTPLGVSTSKPFSGNFDGNGKLLTVPEGNLPLIGVPVGATLSNLNVYGTKIAGFGVVNGYSQGATIAIDKVTLKAGTQTLKSGFIGGYASGQDAISITNSTVEAGVIIGYDKQQSNIGSFAGEYNGTIDNCISYATVYGVNFVGGIAADKGQSIGDFAVTNCQFHGSVIATGDYVGGIVGHGYAGTGWGIDSAPNAPAVTVQNCVCSGSVTGGNYVGGVLGAESGLAQVWENGIGYIQNNSFTGTVSATGSYVGGVIGYMRSLNKYTVITNNYYSGSCGAGKGIGGVQYVDTNCATHETESGALYFSTETATTDCPSVQYCAWKKGHNRTDDPLGADRAKLCYTDSDIAPVATELKIAGTYKTEYFLGEELDLTGMVLTVHFNKGEPKTIDLGDVTVTGYNKDAVGNQTLTLSYSGLTATVTVTVKNKDEITVKVSVLGDSAHGDSGEVHTLSGGGLTTWVAEKSYTIKGDSSVWDMLQLVFSENGITCQTKNSLGSVYIAALTRGGVTLGEYTNGSCSGWMYTINGYHSDLGVDQQMLKTGDVILLHYTDDYTKESGGAVTVDPAVENAKKLIGEIGTVTLDSKAKIEAARTAYDKLSYAQKQKVDNYKTLTDAEAKLAELQADAVEELIKKIGTPIPDYEKEVEAARAAYNALNDNAKKLVENYNNLLQAEKDLATAEDKEKADKVEKLIQAIGTPITVDSEKKITEARKAYDKLTDVQKALVDNYKKLTDAETKLARAKLLKVYEDIYKATGDYMEKLGTPICGETGGEWMVLGLLRSGRELENRDDYYRSIVKFVEENIDENGRLHHAKSTENSRLILALTAMGYDVTNVGGYNLLDGLSDMAFVQKQGINGPIWALIALNSRNYTVTHGDVTREKLLDILLDAQLEDGGWALSGKVSDADITGMALQALAPQYKKDEAVTKAVDKALETLSEMQNADGSYSAFGEGATAESIAQVLTALSVLNIDPTVDARFIKNGKSVVDALCAFFVDDGGFRHVMSGKIDGMATEQGYYALTAFFRMLNEKTALYDMSDVVRKAAPVQPIEAEPMAAFVETAPARQDIPAVSNETESRGDFWLWFFVGAAIVTGIALVVICIADNKKYYGKH